MNIDTNKPSDISDRLRCRYPMGPIMPNGEPEFGWRDFSGAAPEGMVLPTALMLEAANHIDAQAAEIAALRQSWQPIETAPKDGTEVLCWREDCGQFIASYTSPDAFPLTQAEIDQLGEEALFMRDWFTQWPQSIRLDGSETPTHWMPLLAPPAALSGESND